MSLADWIGAHRIGGWEIHERERAYQRLVVCGVIVALDVMTFSGAASGLPMWLLWGGSAYGLASLGYARSLSAPRRVHVMLLCAFLVADPILLLLTIAFDPETFAFLVPMVLLTNTGPGMRYGMRALNLSLALSAVTVIGMILVGEFWKREIQWTAALVLSIALVPLLFTTPIRRIHSVRKLEEDRARLLAGREAVAARAAFLSKVSHELRSPLQSMVSALDVFELRHVDAARSDAELISRMRRASLLLNTQLRDLLTLAKGESGRLDVRQEAVEATELVRSLAEAARPLAQARSLRMVVDVPSAPVFVLADGSRIDQVLTNLVVNSIRFTEEGVVQVTLHPYEAADGWLRFAVADTGRGIAEDELATLFRPEQHGSTTVRRGEGSGIGLAIVRILVEHLGGTISVSSRLGHGTTFDIAIPAPPIVHSEESVVETDDATVGDRVLVVDDRADILEAIVGVLDEIGLPCDQAATSREALNRLASTRYTAALIDLDLRDESGDALARAIRVLDGPNARLRLIAMTAGEGRRDGVSTPALFDGHLVKPVDSHALRRVLHGGTRHSVPSPSHMFRSDA